MKKTLGLLLAATAMIAATLPNLTGTASAAPATVKLSSGSLEANSTSAPGLPVVEVAKKVVKGGPGVRVRKVRPKGVPRARVKRPRVRVHRHRLPAHRRAYRRRALKRGIGIGIGIGIVALIAREAANAEFQAAMRRCARRYYSFDWETGTYVTNSGHVRLCPYLRPYV